MIKRESALGCLSGESSAWGSATGNNHTMATNIKAIKTFTGSKSSYCFVLFCFVLFWGSSALPPPWVFFPFYRKTQGAGLAGLLGGEILRNLHKHSGRNLETLCQPSDLTHVQLTLAVQYLRDHALRADFWQVRLRQSMFIHEEAQYFRTCRYGDYHIKPKEFEKMLGKIPVLSRDRRMTADSLFLDLYHIRRHEVPVNHHLVYDLKHKKLVSGKEGLEAMKSQYLLDEFFDISRVAIHKNGKSLGEGGFHISLSRNGITPYPMTDPEQLKEVIDKVFNY